ncbi:hypothetical protein HYH03_011327 [Edaphochlamys debaryana]|uniref:FAD dependent oxidoreductase domain-containing protein n=1 Tax=Edaphochlamys debaryana TaxID=47281 RepID=A0A835XUV7_9CHLO|nr:hypothetical protein HYH03_011327 [Edaphochlamys debaryana]|eukprot:KAG2490200.1 hypothetical protein HYH03_011327 [Edaphochlamys debaryana]
MVLMSGSSSTVERRAADVAVLGSSALALAAAYSLAKRGKKVVLLPDLGLAGPRPPSESLRALRLTHPDAAWVGLSAEAAAYWRGLEAQAGGSGMRMLAQSRSLELGPGRGDGPGGELLSRVRDAAKAAGVRLGYLRGEELSALFPPLRLPGSVGGLLQPEGGVLHSGAVRSLLLSLAEKQGVLVRERLTLRGWADRGDHFSLRASSRLLPGAESVFEVEQLLLAPDVEGGEHPTAALALFGVEAAMRVEQGSTANCEATSELSSVPLWRTLGLDPPPAPGSPAVPPGLLVATGFPARGGAGGGGGGGQKVQFGLGLLPPSAEGRVLDDPWGWRPEAPDRRGLAACHRLASHLFRGMGLPRLPAAPPSWEAVSLETAEGWGAPTLHAATPDGWPALGFLPGFESGRALFAAAASASYDPPALPAPPPTTASSSATYSAPEPSRNPSAANAAASNATRAGRNGGSAGSTAAAASSTPGASGPGSEAEEEAPLSVLLGGRRLVADGYQLGPLLAKMGADLLCGASRVAETDHERVDLARPALRVEASQAGWARRLDPWGDLGRVQSGAAVREEVPLDEGERERAEAIRAGARMFGVDAAAGDASDEAIEAEGQKRGGGGEAKRKFTFMQG